MKKKNILFYVISRQEMFIFRKVYRFSLVNNESSTYIYIVTIDSFELLEKKNK